MLSPKNDKIERLRLIRSENVGPQTFKRLIALYGSAKLALEHISELSAKGGSKKKVKICLASTAENEIEKLEKYGAHLLFWDDEHYPKNLRLTSDYPPVITALGRLELLNAKNIVALVGSRAASVNGLATARDITKELSHQDVIIASGLAKGIDGCAHKYSKDGASIGVIASGINIIYPLENKLLFEKVAEFGVIVSEYPFDSEPLSRNFPQRNRIISGLSKAVIVIEASLKSGSLITADYAIKQKRKLFVVPGSIMDSKYKGSNLLIKDGSASLMSSTQDVLDFLEIGYLELSDCNQSLIPPQNATTVTPAELDAFRATLHEALSSSPTAIEDIMAFTDIPYQVLNILLLELELAGKIERGYGNMVTRTIDHD